MYRGSYSLFENQFPTPTSTPNKKKGRSADKIAARNEFLLARYYFYSNFFERKLSYPYIIETVAAECFLSPITVPEIIQDNLSQLAALRKESPTIKDLQRKYPHIVWDVKMFLLQNIA